MCVCVVFLGLCSQAHALEECISGAAPESLHHSLAILQAKVPTRSKVTEGGSGSEVVDQHENCRKQSTG